MYKKIASRTFGGGAKYPSGGNPALWVPENMQAAEIIGEPFDFGKLRETNVIEVNHWAKVANKKAHINVQNRSLYAS